MSSGFSPGVSLFPLLLAGLLAGMTYWLDLASRAPAAIHGGSPDDPDYIIENFETRRYGPDGKLQHTLRAAELRHYPHGDRSVIIAPDLVYHRLPPTRIAAREARMDGKGERIELIGDVRIVRAATRDKPATVLTTQRLDVWPDEEVASNGEPVLIVQGQSRIDGSGLHADNKTAIYVLEGRVHGIFQPSTSKRQRQP